ncbi:MAG: hypothetical protein ACJA1Q_001397, partial [Pseudohongiellaceae bacterium]
PTISAIKAQSCKLTVYLLPFDLIVWLFYGFISRYSGQLPANSRH